MPVLWLLLRIIVATCFVVFAVMAFFYIAIRLMTGI